MGFLHSPDENTVEFRKNAHTVKSSRMFSFPKERLMILGRLAANRSAVHRGPDFLLEKCLNEFSIAC